MTGVALDPKHDVVPPAGKRVDDVPILCVASGKGGVGKTSLSLCLASEIARSARVLVIDLDYFNRGATGLIRAETQSLVEGVSLVEALSLYTPGAEVPQDSQPPIRMDLVRRHENILVCPCPELPQPIIRGLHDRLIPELGASLEGLIAWICQAHRVQCVVVDAHGGPDPLSFAACEIADHTILVTEPDKVTLYGAMNFMAILKSYSPGPMAGRIHLIFNRVSSHFSYKGIEQVYLRDLADLFGRPLLAMIPFDDEIFDHFGNAPLITDLFPYSTFASKIKLIARRILLADHPHLIEPKVRRWSRWKDRKIHRQLRRRDFARPASIAILWLITLIGLFLVTTSAVFDALGQGPAYYTLMMTAGSTAGVAGLLALYNSFKLVVRTALRNLRFSRNTPLQQLYAAKVVMNGAILLAMSGLILLGVVVPIISGVGAAREAARRAQCVNNLKQISLAFHNYESTYDCFPSAYMPDKDGKPMHSWRVAILPFMEQSSLFNAYNFSVPWDAVQNITVGKSTVSVYSCPSDGEKDPSYPSYSMVIGPGTLSQPSAARTSSNGKATDPVAEKAMRNARLRDITDGTSNTIGVVETLHTHFNWTKPDDLSTNSMSFQINDPNGPCISSHHPGGANVSLVDGSVKFLKNTLTAKVLRDLLTPSGGEIIRSDTF